jgi:hypothetical protein
MLSDTMNGNYVIRCGNCNHEHYRCIVDGKVTETRHDKTKRNLDIIHVMKSACQKEKKTLGVVAQMRSRLFADSMGGGV